MLVQTMNAITRRFQNVRGPGRPDPLANLEIDPLRPLNNLLWGYIQDEQHRLTRRAAQLRVRPPVRRCGSRARRCRACARPTRARSSSKPSTTCCACARSFFKQDDDTTVKADAFPVLNALKEVHLILTAGRAQPVRRSAVDGADRDADAAVAAGAAGVPRVPADARSWSPTRSRGWIGSTR